MVGTSALIASDTSLGNTGKKNNDKVLADLDTDGDGTDEVAVIK